ncbi:MULTISPECIES: HNH endonuclease [unclassified Mesorhizobium]|uniref:HNH endonuclease n=1 Tax=unclassified Mesorhizobium TaxID=325217 RepID=UPI0015E2A692|nr:MULTISPECIES: HNH endonuclease [unclassified Mesorhizobium]MBZ9919105.1 HNH endonuclease [Mesorhizobium sp. BR1-1-7]MBZ9970116.1 HNH endonuclease [Mesorhizobium sp. BR1-1-12]
MQKKPHPRSLEAEAYRKLYRDPRWCGPQGIRRQALRRDLWTCQRCGCLVIEGNRHHPQAAVINHKIAHKGDETLFFDLDNTETVCKSDHDTLIQREEARGYTIGADINGRPVDPNHPWNARQIS